MPVRFLGGGGGGGGSTDVRAIIADPTLTTVAATTTETVTCVWQIPANHLLAKDSIFISLAGITTLATTVINNTPIYKVRIGTTGTITDSLIDTIAPTFGSSNYRTKYSDVANANVLFENLIYFNSIGASGTCRSAGRIDNKNNEANRTVSSVPDLKSNTTVDTTSLLYISITVTFPTTANTFTPRTPFLSFSL